MGGLDYWLNGIYLVEIEVVDSVVDEFWCNINVINDLVCVIIEMMDCLVILVVWGNVGVGGVFFSLVVDEVWVGDCVIFNLYYKDMGNLFGLEYWIYLLFCCVGVENVMWIMQC